MQAYRLRPSDIARLKVHEVDNPHYKKAAPMQLYMLSQIRNLALEKYGTSESYIVGLKLFDSARLSWFADQPERLFQLTPEQFQFLVANRLDELGLEVNIVGNVNRKDGGIDIIAIPRRGFPFLLAVQAKHHRSDRKTPVSDVRDLNGAVQSTNSAFHMGMIVTNTSFTPDAAWFADNNARFLRLRDSKDLCRWMHNDFLNESEYREIPAEITLAPGVTISVPKKELWIPEE